MIGLLACAALGSAYTRSFPPPGRIVYSGGGGRGLFVARPDGSGARQITTGPSDFSPQWSPDRRGIAFVRSVASDVTAIWVVNADGTGALALDADHPYAEHPRWSPNGRWLAYQVQTSTYIRSGTRAHTTFDLWLVRPDGSGRRLLARGETPLENDDPRYKRRDRRLGVVSRQPPHRVRARPGGQRRDSRHRCGDGQGSLPRTGPGRRVVARRSPAGRDGQR